MADASSPPGRGTSFHFLPSSSETSTVSPAHATVAPFASSGGYQATR